MESSRFSHAVGLREFAKRKLADANSIEAWLVDGVVGVVHKGLAPTECFPYLGMHPIFSWQGEIQNLYLDNEIFDEHKRTWFTRALTNRFCSLPGLEKTERSHLEGAIYLDIAANLKLRTIGASQLETFFELALPEESRHLLLGTLIGSVLGIPSPNLGREGYNDLTRLVSKLQETERYDRTMHDIDLFLAVSRAYPKYLQETLDSWLPAIQNLHAVRGKAMSSEIANALCTEIERLSTSVKLEDSFQIQQKFQRILSVPSNDNEYSLEANRTASGRALPGMPRLNRERLQA